MAAIGAVGKVYEPWHTERALILGYLHLDQPLEGGALPCIQLAELQCESVQFVQTARLILKIRSEEPEIIVIVDFEVHFLAVPQAELVQRVQQRPRQRRKVEPSVCLAARHIRFCEIDIEDVIQVSCLPSAWSVRRSLRGQRRVHPSRPLNRSPWLVAAPA